MDYKKAAKYFNANKLSIKGIIIAAIVIIILFAIKAVVGIIALIIVGVVIALKYTGIPSDSEIDALYEKELQDLKQKALSKLGIDEDEVKIIEPILISGPNYENAFTKLGKDNKWRSSSYEAIYLFFSEKQVYSYQYNFSITADVHNQSTDEYFYKDIVSISTSSDSTKIVDKKGKESSINYEQFKLTTSGGTSITCSLRDPGLFEKSIQGMKQLLREKKNS